MRKQEQVLTVVALVLLAGVILYNVFAAPPVAEPAETAVSETTVLETLGSETVTEPSVVTAPPEEPSSEATTAVAPAPTATTAAPGIDETGRVNLNTATKEDLTTLNGIGEAKAQAILDYRTEHGSFASPSDIVNVSGIGQKTYENIKDNITV